MQPTARKRFSRVTAGVAIALAVLGIFLFRHVTQSLRTRSDRERSSILPDRTYSDEDEAQSPRGGVKVSLGGADSDSSGTLEGGGASAGTRFGADDTASSSLGVLRVRLVWLDSVQPVPDTPVDLRWEEGEATATKVAVTDAQGVATIVHPPEWTRATVGVRRPRLWFEPTSVRLPTPSMLTLHVVHLFSAYGKVFAIDEKGEEKPVEGARVIAAGEKAQETASDADGAWVMNDLREKAVTFHATHEDLLARVKGKEGPIALDPEKDNGPFDFVLEKAGVTLSGAVLREDDLAPISSATVRCQTLGAEATTDDKGDYCMEEPLPAGRYEFAVTAAGYGDAVYTIDLKAGQDEIAIFHLKKGGIIHAQVVDKEDVPVGDAKVHLLDTLGARRTQKTDAEGRTDFAGLDIEDTFTIWSWEDAKTSNPQTVLLGTKRPEANVKLTMPWALSEQEDKESPIGVFEGTVTDLEDNPIAGVTVQFLPQYAAEAENREGDTALSAIDGRYRMEMAWTDGSPYEVSAYGEGWATQWAPAVRPGTAENPTRVDFKMPPERWVKGTVVDTKQRPIESARCQVWPGQIGPGQPRPFAGQALVYTDVEGKFYIAGIDGDYVEVEIYKPGYRAIVALGAPTNEESVFVMEQLGTLRGRVIDAATGAPVTDFSLRVSGRNVEDLDPRLGRQRHKFFSPDGRFLIDWVHPENMYTIAVEAPHYISYVPQPWEWWQAGFLEYVPEGLAKGDDIVLKLERAQEMGGVVVDAATQRPVVGAAVISGLPREWSQAIAHREDLQYTKDQLFYNVKAVQTDSNGRFWFEGKETGTASALLVWLDGYAPFGCSANTRTRYIDTSTGDLKIPLGRGAQVAISVVLGGQPQPGETVFVTALPGTTGVGHLMGIRSTDAAGAVVFSNVPAGAVLVGCTRHRDEDVSFPARAREIEVGEGGQANVDLGDNPGSAILSGAVKCKGKAVGGVLVKVAAMSGNDSFVAHSGTGKDGSYRVVGIPAGAYLVSVMANVTGSTYDSPDYDFPADNKRAKRRDIAGEIRQDFDIPDFFDE